MNYKNLNQEEGDRILKKELSTEKVKIIEKYELKSTPDLCCISEKENSYKKKFHTKICS